MIFLRMQARCADTFPKIYQHQFNQQLYAGTLSSDIFRLFLEQDEIYLRDFSKALLLLSCRFTCNEYTQQFESLSKYIKEAELALHRDYLEDFHSQHFFVPAKTEPRKIPVIKQYTEHLLYSAEHVTIEEAVASLLPCFWIYCELGKQMDILQCGMEHPYRDWIATYSDEEFITTTNSIIHTLEKLTSTISCPELQEKIIDSFAKSAEYELMFFDAALSGKKKIQKIHEEQYVYRC